MTRRDVPIPRRRQPRIKVGRAVGDPAEFYRRTARTPRLRQRVEEGLGARLEVRAAYHHDQFVLRPRAGVDWLRRSAGARAKV